MLEYIVAYTIAGALVCASEDTGGAASFYFGDVARWMLPRFPDAPEGWE